MFSISRNNRWLSIVVGDGSLCVTEAHREGDGIRAGRRGRFTLPKGSNLENLLTVAPAFADFLGERGFETRRAIVGLPAKYFLFHEFKMPRVDEQTTAQALWHHASTVIAPEVGSVALDYLGDRGAAREQKLAIVGIQDRLLRQLQSFCEAAGIEPICVTPTVLALAAISESAGLAALVVNAQSNAAEMVVQVEGVPRLMKYVNAATASMLQSELRRVAARFPAITSADSTTLDRSARTRSLVIWNEPTTGVDRQAMSEASGLPTVTPLREWIGVQPTESSTDDPEGWTELALIDYGTSPARARIDLLHPRLREPVVRKISQRWTIGAACAAVALLVMLAAFVDLKMLQHSADASQAKLNAIEPQVRAAKPLLQRMQYASAFQSHQPRYLTCLRDLTVAVSTSSAITLNHFDLNGAMQGSCSGEAALQQDAVDFVDRLGASKRFGRMSCKLDSHASSGQAENVSFRIAFQYVPNG